MTSHSPATTTWVGRTSTPSSGTKAGTNSIGIVSSYVYIDKSVVSMLCYRSYRYTPGETPRYKIFAVENLNVNVSIAKLKVEWLTPRYIINALYNNFMRIYVIKSLNEPNLVNKLIF